MVPQWYDVAGSSDDEAGALRQVLANALVQKAVAHIWYRWCNVCHVYIPCYKLESWSVASYSEWSICPCLLGQQGLADCPDCCSFMRLQQRWLALQVRVDAPRTAPGVACFHQAAMQKCLERILYLWGIRWVPRHYTRLSQSWYHLKL